MKGLNESRISAGATEKLPGWEKPHAKTVAWSYTWKDILEKCVEILRAGTQKDRAIIQSFESLL